MHDEISTNKLPMVQSEMEHVERKMKSIRLMYFFYILIIVVFSAMTGLGIYFDISILIIIGLVFIAAYVIVGLLYLGTYNDLRQDLTDCMKFSETGILEEIYWTFGKGRKYWLTMNGKTRQGFREMHDLLKKGDRIELYLASHSKIPVGFQKLD